MRLTLFNVNDTQGTIIGRGWIVQDVTERHELDRLKSTLIATVSHELRTPLAAIKGYTTTLLADDVQWDEASQREFLMTISAETDRLSNLVRDLLDMSRLEAGNLAVSRISCDLAQLIEQAVTPRIASRVRVTLPDSRPAIFVDPQRIEAVLRNLIENAAKYSPEDQPILINVRLEGGQLITQVLDFGPGIPKEHRERIFDSFYRIENGLTRTTSGAGLGLSIARGFIQIHGGKIWLEPGEIGTCIAFSIPVQPDTQGTISQQQLDILNL
jgi:signal transduction histidine kinase